MFAVDTSTQLLSHAWLLYRSEEYAFDTEPEVAAGIGSALFDDLNLELNSLGQVIAVWGLCPHTRWEERALIPPHFVPGTVLYEPASNLVKGVSFRLTSGGHLPVYADKVSGWICVENGGATDKSIEVMPGVVFEISSAGRLNRIWLKPKRSGVK